MISLISTFLYSFSHVIVTYLVDKYAKDDSLYPKDIKKRAQVDQKLYFDATILFPRLRAVTVSTIVHQYFENLTTTLALT